MTSEFSAASAALGYYFQARYALLLLLRGNSDSEMSIERFDDVAFEENGKPVELIQTKHRINSTASLSNSSTDLWKTLRIWSTQIADGTIRPEEVILTLVTTGSAPSGSAASKLRPKETGTRNVDEALSILLKTANESSSETNKNGYDAFLTIGEDNQRKLLESVRVLDASSQINDTKKEILQELRLTVLPKFQDMLYERLEGWWFDIVVKHLSEQTPKTILFRELHAEINDIQKQFEDDNLPIDFLNAVAPSESELSVDQRVFIEQLRLVAVSNPRIKNAISDYYRAYEQRSKWIREDLLLVGELEKYEKRLADEWSELFNIMKEDLGESPTEDKMMKEGKALYTAIWKDVSIPIRPRVTESYVVRGSYHILSNKLQVGWHLNFIKRLSSLLQPISVTKE